MRLCHYFFNCGNYTGSVQSVHVYDYIFWIEFHFICVCYKPRLAQYSNSRLESFSRIYKIDMTATCHMYNSFPELHTISACETWLNFGQVSSVIIHPFAQQDIGNIPFLHRKSLKPQSNSTVQCGCNPDMTEQQTFIWT